MRTRSAVRYFGLAALPIVVVWLVAACGAPPVATGSVEGIVSQGGLLPVSGVVVRSQGTSTLTDAEGRFTLEGIAVPYDLSLSQTSGDGWLHVIEGMTDRAPVVDPVGYPGFAAGDTTTGISGALSGGPGAWPLPAGRRVVVCVEGLDALVFGCGTVPGGESTYVLNANLIGVTTSDVRLHALRIVVDVDGRPTGYEGYGSADLAITAGVPVVAPVVLDVPTPVADLEVAFDVPGGAVLDGGLVVLRLGARGSIFLFEGDADGSGLSLPVPVLPGARYGVFGVVEAAGGTAVSWSIVDGLDGGTLAFVVPPQLTTPPVDATGVTPETAFEAVVAGTGPRTFRWTAGAGPAFALTTTRASVTMPDPVAAGLAWPAGAVYTWRVIAYEGATVDDAAATLDPTILVFSIYTGLEPPATGRFAATNERGVTLAP